MTAEREYPGTRGYSLLQSLGPGGLGTAGDEWRTPAAVARAQLDWPQISLDPCAGTPYLDAIGVRTNRKRKRARCKARRRARLRAARMPRVVFGFDGSKAIDALERAEIALSGLSERVRSRIR